MSDSLVKAAERESLNFLFLDTEFTTLDPSSELLSLGLVPMQEHLPELYLERCDYRRDSCSEFVQKTVLPSFGRHPEAVCKYVQMSYRIHQWAKLLGAGPFTLVCDSDWDERHVGRLMGGLYPENLSATPRIISNIASDLAFEIRQLKYFRDLRLLQHHALYDARAIRYAYRCYFGIEV